MNDNVRRASLLFCVLNGAWSLRLTAVAEMVQLEQTSPTHRTSSRDSDDTGEATPTHVRADPSLCGHSLWLGEGFRAVS